MEKIGGFEKSAGLIAAFAIVFYGVGIYNHLLQIKEIKRNRLKSAENNNINNT